MGADFGGVRVHTGAEPDRLTGALQATACTVGQDVYFHGSAYDPRSRSGQELIAHELAHVVQQNGSRIRGRPQADGDQTRSAPAVSPAPQGRVQRKFGFEIELPMLFTYEDDTNVTSLAGGPNIALKDVPMDAGDGGPETHLRDYGQCYLNVDHSRTLDDLFKRHLARYALDKHLDANATNSLLAAQDELIPNHASIVEVVTKPWNETRLSRSEALAKVQSVVGRVNTLFDRIEGRKKASVGNYYIGSKAPYSNLFQPRVGYFHATYGVKLSQVPYLFEQTTKQKKNLAEYVKEDPKELPHAKNVELTGRSVTAARSALKGIKKIWPRVVVPRKILPNTTRVDLSPKAENDFLGFLTLLCNYFLLLRFGSSGGTLGKQLVGMHYYKSDLYDVVTRLPDEVKNPLRDADTSVVDNVIDLICDAVGITYAEDFDGKLGDHTAVSYLYQIIRGHYGVIQDGGVDKVDVAGQTFMDPLLAHTINPWSRKLGPERLGPRGNRGLGVVLENRHLEYLDPNYGARMRAWNAQLKADLARYAAPAGGPDTRTPKQKAMYESIYARESGPARVPIAEWESLMMGIYDMVTAANARV